MAASVYAGIGRQRGWLDLDRALTAAEYGMLRRAVAGWCGQDSTAAGILAAFGAPSVLTGGTGPQRPKTFMYATARPADPAVYFHLWNSPGRSGAAPPAPSPRCSPPGPTATRSRTASSSPPAGGRLAEQRRRG